MTVTARSDLYEHKELSINSYNVAYEEVQRLEEHALEMARDKMVEIYNDLEEEYYGLISDEAVKETLLANEYEYTEDGNLW